MRGKMLKKSVLLLLFGSAVGALLLTLAYMLPVNSANKSASFETLDSEGWYPRASVAAAAYDKYLDSVFPDVLDGMTDRTMLSTAMDTNEGNPFWRAMDSYNEFNGHYLIIGMVMSVFFVPCFCCLIIRKLGCLTVFASSF